MRTTRGISFDGFATLGQFPTLYLIHDNSTEFAGHRPETGLGEGHKGHKARNHGAADEKPVIWLGDLVLVDGATAICFPT